MKKLAELCMEHLAHKCTCHEDYKSRKLRDPNCEYCDIGQYILPEAERILGAEWSKSDQPPQVNQSGDVGKCGPQNAGWPKVDKEKWKDWLTVGRLKKIIEDMPDDALVLAQRVEDVYFDKYGWKGLKRPCLEYPDDIEGDQYLNVWYGLRYKKIDEHLYLTLHY